MITSKKRVIYKTDEYLGDLIKTKVPVWNPTVANLTLMALGSSAPEILLNVIETLNTLGAKPGELGPSTIVGSAAFNFLIISALSIVAVNESNDIRTKAERDEDGTPKGVKKVADTGVFAITTTWSIIAYVWLYVVLLDKKVEPWEAYLTLSFMVALLIMAYIADCLRRQTIKRREDEKYGHGHSEAADLNNAHGGQNKTAISEIESLNVVDFYNKLLPIEGGETPLPGDQQLTSDMKEFLMREFGTTKVSEVPKETLKARLEGPQLIERIGHRKAVAINYKREAIAKGQILRRENKSAKTLSDKQKNPKFGFSCLHYSVSESAGALRIKILNKQGKACSVAVRTVDGDAKANEDFEPIDEVVNFKSGQKEAEVKVGIRDDDDWEPDEDFYVELYDEQTKQRLFGDDTRTRVTILDDDKPGQLVFEEKQTLRHPANEKNCTVTVNRIHGSDGEIRVKFKTIQIDQTAQTATPGLDFVPIEDELIFKH